MSSDRITYPTAIRASESPNATALVCGELSLTHAEVERRVTISSSRLLDLGVQPEDRVAVGAANSIEWIILVHAVNRVGATLVPLNTRFARIEITERLALYEPRVVIGDDEFRSNCANAITFHTLAETETAPRDTTDTVDPSVISSIVSTSGTSGEPKGVCLTLANHLAGAKASHENLNCGPGDRWLINLPLYHVGGLAIVYRAALCGFTIVIHHEFSAENTLEAIRSRGITHLSLVETTLARILALNGDRSFPSSVRAVLVGGGPVDEELLHRARNLGLPVLPTYGLTEAGSQVATMRPGESSGDFGIGVPPLPGYHVEIRDPEGHALAAGAEGEIWISGPMVSSGYWTSPGEITPSTIDGWLPTGDIGAMSPGGLLSVRGRRTEMIISGGENIYPSEVERALVGLPGVRRAAVIGISDPEWGQIPVALVELDNPGAGIADRWRESLRGCLAGYKIPRSIIPVDALPITPLGKIERSSLAELYRRSIASRG